MDQDSQLNCQLLTPARLQWVMDVSESTVTSWLAVQDKDGRRRPPAITHFRDGRVIRIMPAEVLGFIARRSVNSRRSKIEGQGLELDAAAWQRIERLIATCVAANMTKAELEKAA